MKLDFCSTKYRQTGFSAELGTGICTALRCGVVGATLTPQLAVLLEWEKEENCQLSYHHLNRRCCEGKQ